MCGTGLYNKHYDKCGEVSLNNEVSGWITIYTIFGCLFDDSEHSAGVQITIFVCSDFFNEYWSNIFCLWKSVNSLFCEVKVSQWANFIFVFCVSFITAQGHSLDFFLRKRRSRLNQQGCLRRNGRRWERMSWRWLQDLANSGNYNKVSAAPDTPSLRRRSRALN